MATYQRSVRVRAPFEEVWDFHQRVEGLEALTPDFLHMRAESVTGPAGEPDPEELAAGSEIVASVRPVGLGPRQRFTSRIVERTRDDHSARFRDVMVEGPFAEWEHTHRFVDEGAATQVHDHVTYRLPLGAASEPLGPLARLGLAPMFRYRHRRTKTLLED